MNSSPARPRNRFDGIVVGHGRCRATALQDAREIVGGPVEQIAATEVAGTWAVLARPLTAD